MSNPQCRGCCQPLGGVHLPDCIWEDLVVPSECGGFIEEAVATVRNRDLERGRAQGVAEERARVVAWLVKHADRTGDDKMGPVKIVLLNSAVVIERGEHEEATCKTT